MASIIAESCNHCKVGLPTKHCDHCVVNFCDSCFETVHSNGRTKKHTYNNLSDEQMQQNYQQYQQQTECCVCNQSAKIYCGHCRKNYCTTCCDKAHELGRTKKHPRKVISDEIMQQYKNYQQQYQQYQETFKLDQIKKNILTSCDKCKFGLPTIHCEYCRVNYCVACCDEHHKLGRTKKHVRKPISAEKIQQYCDHHQQHRLMLCTQCSKHPSIYCAYCKATYCDECNTAYHVGRKNKHTREDLSFEQLQQLQQYQLQCRQHQHATK